MGQLEGGRLLEHPLNLDAKDTLRLLCWSEAMNTEEHTGLSSQKQPGAPQQLHMPMASQQESDKPARPCRQEHLRLCGIPRNIG